MTLRSRIKSSFAAKALCFTAGLLALGAVASAQQVNFQLNVPVGTTYQFSSTESSDMNMTMSVPGMGQQQMQQQMQHQMAGTMKVLESNNGRPSRLEIAFDPKSGGQMTGPGGNQQMPFALAGQTVTVTLDADGNASLQPAGNVDPQTLQAVEQLASFEDAFFPGRPVGPGDTWQINAADMPDAPPGAQGNVQLRLDGVQNIAGRDTAVLQIQAKMNGMEQGMQTTVDMAGPLLVDIQTGIPVKVDLSGQVQLAGKYQEQGMSVDVQGTGQMKQGGEVQNLQVPGGAAPPPVVPNNRPDNNGNNGANNGANNNGANNNGGNTGALTGSYNGDGMGLTIGNGQPMPVTIELGGQTYQGTIASFDGQTFTGKFQAGGASYDFNGSVNGNNLTLHTGTTTYNLTKQGGGNPPPAGGGGGGTNPLG